MLIHPTEVKVDYNTGISMKKNSEFIKLVQSLHTCKNLKIRIFTGIYFKVNGITVKELIDQIFLKPVRELTITSMINEE